MLMLSEIVAASREVAATRSRLKKIARFSRVFAQVERNELPAAVGFMCGELRQGRLGLVCDGSPLVIPVSPQQPVYVDTDAIVGWTAQLETSLHRSQSLGSMFRGGSGEAVQLMFQGQGHVVVRPSELTPQKAQQH